MDIRLVDWQSWLVAMCGVVVIMIVLGFIILQIMKAKGGIRLKGKGGEELELGEAAEEDDPGTSEHECH